MIGYRISVCNVWAHISVCDAVASYVAHISICDAVEQLFPLMCGDSKTQHRMEPRRFARSSRSTLSGSDIPFPFPISSRQLLQKIQSMATPSLPHWLRDDIMASHQTAHALPSLRLSGLSPGFLRSNAGSWKRLKSNLLPHTDKSFPKPPAPCKSVDNWPCCSECSINAAPGVQLSWLHYELCPVTNVVMSNSIRCCVTTASDLMSCVRHMSCVRI